MENYLIRNDDEAVSKITIQDMADALGISKTTVSRAISGKGRIGSETRNKVLEYIEKNNYKPNPIAKGLAKQKTYNIAWIMPGDPGVTDLPFFQKCMSGVICKAQERDYDVLISMVYDDDISSLKRIVTNQKIDGAVLGRTLTDDENVRFLKESGIPFVVIGSTDEKNVIQVDNDHVKACGELISILLLKGLKNLVLICGSDRHIVNLTRREGFESAIGSAAKKIKSEIYMNSDNEGAVGRIVDNAIHENVECIVCADDKICAMVIDKLHKENVKIPEQIKVASFYNSEIIENNQPPITTLKYDPRELGITAASLLFSYIEGNEVPGRTYLPYEVMLKGSTQ